jgi:hypothetical protein
MSISAHFVSWPELVERFNARPNRADFLFRSEDAEEPWVERIHLWTDSPTAAERASDVYDKLRAYLAPDVRAKFDRLLGVFFWWNRADPWRAPTVFQDLSDEADREAFAVTMKPESVARHLALWDPAAFEQLRGPFQVEFPRGVEHFEDFDEFVEYVRVWVGLLRDAGNRGRGLVVSVFAN